MKRTIAASVLLAAGAVAGALAYNAAAQDRAYRALLDRGDAALADDQTFDAIEEYSGAVAIRPDSMLAHLRRGEAYERRNDLEAATNDFRIAADLDPTATRPLEALGDVLYRRGRFRRAAEAYERRLAVDGQAPRIAYKLGLARYRQGNFDAALAAAGDAINLDQRLAEGYYLIGLCLRAQGQLRPAATAFEKVTTLSPGMLAAREELAALYGAMGRRADEIEQLQFLAILERSRPERQVAVGLAQARAGQEELAVLTLGNALERAPDHPLVFGALGQVWLARAVEEDDQVFLRKALEALERVASTSAAPSEMLAAYGRALLLDNQLAAAERILQQASRRYPVHAAALLAYADVAERRNHFDAARTAVMEYAALAQNDPAFVAHAITIARLSLRVNDKATAAVWIGRGLRRDPGNQTLLTLSRRAR
ncbi:MAG TPA: tetratricopeptide repeat protein [Solirubrobacter sp.]|nr:tetratricopeptide repeat protein [Solirubrobacter sp.]